MDQEELPADASTLIYLAKSDAFRKASRCVAALVVPPAVWREAVVEGERSGHPDVFHIREAEQERFVRRVELEAAYEVLAARIAGEFNLGLGESEVLALAREAGRVVIDDGRASRVAEALGIRPFSTLFLPVLGRRARSLDEAEALAMLRRLAVAANARAEVLVVVEQFIRGVR